MVCCVSCPGLLTRTWGADHPLIYVGRRAPPLLIFWNIFRTFVSSFWRMWPSAVLMSSLRARHEHRRRYTTPKMTSFSLPRLTSSTRRGVESPSPPLSGTNIWSQGRASFLGTFWGLKFEALCAPILGPLGRVSEDPQTPKPLPLGRGEEAAGIPHTSARGLFTGGGTGFGRSGPRWETIAGQGTPS